MHFKILLFISFVSFFSGFAQDVNTVNIDFNLIPKSSNYVGYNNASIELNIPTKISKGFLINSVSYSKYTMEYPTSSEWSLKNINSYNSVSYSIKYLNDITSKWSCSLQISPTLSSNFATNISKSDFILNGRVILINKNNNGNLFKIGIIRNTNFGNDMLLPYVAFISEIDNLNFSIGFPNTTINYQINPTNTLSLYAKPKGFYANLNNKMILNSSTQLEKAKYESIISGINFAHKIDDFWKIVFDAGYQLGSSYNLLNKNKSVFKFKTKNQIYIGFNLKFNMLNKKN